MKKYENIRDRIVDSIQNVYLLSSSEEESFSSSIKILSDRKSFKKEKLTAMLRILQQVLPASFNKLIKNKVGFSLWKLPIEANLLENFKKIGEGGVNKVFFLGATGVNSSQLVLKIPHHKKDNTFEAILSQKKEYEEIKKYFEDIFEFILPEEYIIVHSSNGRFSIGVVIQRFVASGMRDIFTEISPEELGEELKLNKSLRNSVENFLNVIEENPELIDNHLDLLGEKNLSIVDTDEGMKLMLMDPHYRNINHEDLSDFDFKRGGEIKNRVKYLADIMKDIKIVETTQPMPSFG